MDQSRWAKLLLFVNVTGVVSARRTRAERRRCSWIETYPFAVLVSIVIVDSPLAGFCHPPAGACRGEGKFIAKYWKCGFGRSFGCSPRSYTVARLPKLSLQFLTPRSFCIAVKCRRLSVGKSIGNTLRYLRDSRLYRIPVRLAGKA